MIESVAIIALSLVVLALLLIALYSAHRWTWWKSQCEATEGAYKDAIERIALAEKNAEHVNSEYRFLKEGLGTLLTRPVLAALSEQQLQYLAENISVYLDAARKTPAELN